jgi:putative glutathione S-transferase
MKAQFPEESSAEGEFERQEDGFRDWVHDRAPSGRYHLYVSLACPWANRTMIVRKLKGLVAAVSMSVADPVRDERGWAFREGPGHGADAVNGFKFLSEAYVATNPNFRGRITVPVLWDKEERRIVNNSEDDICRMFNDSFADATRDPDLFPAGVRKGTQ